MSLLRLPLEIKDLFREWLETHQPGRAAHVMSLIRSMRGGKDYDAEWGKRMKGTGVYAELIAKRFKLACERLGLNKDWLPLRVDLFKPPPKDGRSDAASLTSRAFMPTFTRERRIEGPVAGIDEAGRGPLAGPVLCGGRHSRTRRACRAGVNDFKVLTRGSSAKARSTRSWRARSPSASASANVDEIDEINILQATMLAMRRATEALSLEAGACAGRRQPRAALACPVETHHRRRREVAVDRRGVDHRQGHCATG